MNQKELIERNIKLKELAEKGASYPELGKIFNVSIQRIAQIFEELGLSRKKIKYKLEKEKYEPLAQKYNETLKNRCFYDVRSEITKEGLSLHKLKRFGFKYEKIKLIEIRNKKVALTYKNGKTAKELIDIGVCGIKSVSGIYMITKKEKSQKFPMIKTGKGSLGVYEDKKLIKRLIYLREKRNLHYNEICEIMNKEGYRTVSGKLLCCTNIGVKYRKYTKLYRRKAHVKFIKTGN